MIKKLEEVEKRLKSNPVRKLGRMEFFFILSNPSFLLLQDEGE